MKGIDALDRFYTQHEEPVRSLLLSVRDIVLLTDNRITHQMKYGMPFFSFEGKMLCYLWVHHKLKSPYLGLVDGNQFDEPFLLQEKRSRMKIMVFDASKDIPIRKLKSVLKKAIDIRVRRDQQKRR